MARHKSHDHSMPGINFGKSSAKKAQKPLGVIKIKPQEKLSLSLGNFPLDNPPQGITIELTPDPDPPDSIVTEIVNVGASERYDLVLEIANFGNKAVVAKAWGLDV